MKEINLESGKNKHLYGCINTCSKICNIKCCEQNHIKQDGKLSKNSIANLFVGEGGVICGYATGIDIRTKRRLLELGFVVGEKIKIENASIMKDVFLVAVRGCLMSVRREILNFVYVVKNK